MKRYLLFLLGVVFATGAALGQPPAGIGPAPGQFVAGPALCPGGGSAIVATPPSQAFLYISDINFPQTFAVQFTLPSGGATLGEVVVIGAYANPFDPPGGTPPGNETFGVRLRNDDGGSLPGVVIFEQSGVAPTSFATTGVVLFGVNEIEAILPLPPVSLVAGDYWIEIFGETPDPDDWWHWEVGSPVDPNQSPDSAYSFDGTNWIELGNVTLAVTLCDALPIAVDLIEFEVE